jgi:hypothetical protein
LGINVFGSLRIFGPSPPVSIDRPGGESERLLFLYFVLKLGGGQRRRQPGTRKAGILGSCYFNGGTSLKSSYRLLETLVCIGIGLSIGICDGRGGYSAAKDSV